METLEQILQVRIVTNKEAQHSCGIRIFYGARAVRQQP